MIVTDRTLLWGVINTHLGIASSSDFRAIGNVVNDKLGVVVGYNGFIGKTCWVHIYVEDPATMTPSFVKAIFDYPFNQLKLKTLLTVVEESNKQALNIDHRAGFRDMAYIQGAANDGGGLYILRMHRHDCKFLKENRNGKEIRTGSTGLRGGRQGTGGGQSEVGGGTDAGEQAERFYSLGGTDVVESGRRHLVH